MFELRPFWVAFQTEKFWFRLEKPLEFWLEIPYTKKTLKDG